MKIFILLLLLFAASIGYSQSERYVEVVVSDSAFLQPIRYQYLVKIDNGNDFVLPEKVLNEETGYFEPQKSLFEIAVLLKKKEFEFTIEDSYSPPLSYLKSDSVIIVNLNNESELERLKNIISEEMSVSGFIGEVFYESISLYEEELYRSLYKKAERKAKLIVSYSGGTIGHLISASENLSKSGGPSDWYEELMKLGTLGRNNQASVGNNIEVVQMVFRFELK